MTMAKRAVTAVGALAVMIVIAPGSAYASVAQDLAGTGFQLPGCAVTYLPTASSTAGAECLRSESGEARSRESSAAGPTITIYQNGPYGSDNMRRGEAWTLTYSGWYKLPFFMDNEASAWRSYCTAGHFFDVDPNSGGTAHFPAGSAGNFPRGGVGNDRLSGVAPFRGC
ncbi:hypothetical protein ACFO4E_16540 [Nocardiopsis mangrovi]|uniref:Secreted protein n=1 Tax=Nocardiopsis mangrovi TaxID=1179818 RepID=A0ABV9DZS6_9ACTN